ncbi:MAG: RecQ family ATP-dependent DNA helicase [Urechidicola sp.]|nr:RecQ family ATP-dependent DNA helicase [Urechidicola sp.]
MEAPIEILKKYWGYDEFRYPQEEIISSVLNGTDTLALLPTGGGKSICFQIPTLVNDGVCIVVSPLIALMNDQVKNLNNRNIKAIALTSKLTPDEVIIAFDNLQFGNYKFLYLSPEKLQSELIQQKIKQLNVQLVAIDEAHCISEWGHDFRPSYLNISILREFFPQVPMIALTASATEKVTQDIVENLGLDNPKIFKKSFLRENLAYQIFEVEDKLFKVEQVLKKVKGSKIIYTDSRRSTVEISAQLNHLGYTTNFYHGGMKHDAKSQHYEDWLSEKTPIIVATNAFGMGIDKSDVRSIIHYNLPQSVENYLQEAGRGGRDGKKSFSIVLKNKTDILNTKTRLQKNLPSIDFIKQVYFNLNQHFQIAYGEISEKKYGFNLPEFCDIYKTPIVVTFNALKILEQESILIIDDNIHRKSTVRFKISNQAIFDYCESNQSKNNLIKLLLRTYGGIFESPKTINVAYLAKVLSISSSALINQLKQLHHDEIIQFYNANNNTQIQFLVQREDDRTINVRSKNISQRNNQKVAKMEALIDFIETDTICRSKQLLTYFGEQDIADCGICDVCLSKKNQKKKTNKEEISKEILMLLKNYKSLSSKEISSQIEASEKTVLFCIEILLEKNILAVTSHNKYTLK